MQSRLQSRQSKTPFDKSFVRVVVLQEKEVPKNVSILQRETLYDSHYSSEGPIFDNNSLRLRTLSTHSLDGHDRKKKRSQRRATSYKTDHTGTTPPPRSSSFVTPGSKDTGNKHNRKFLHLDVKTIEMIFGRNNRPRNKVNVKIHYQPKQIIFSLLFRFSSKIDNTAIKEMEIFSIPKGSKDKKRSRRSMSASYDEKGNTQMLKSFSKMEEKPKPLSPPTTDSWKRSNSSEITKNVTSSFLMTSVHRSASIPIKKEEIEEEEEEEEEINSSFEESAGVLVESSPNVKPSFLKDSLDGIINNNNQNNNQTDVGNNIIGSLLQNSTELCDTMTDNGIQESDQFSVISLSIIFELLSNNTAVQDIISSQYGLIHYRARILLEILYYALNKTLNQLSDGNEENHVNIEKYMLNFNEEFNRAVISFQQFFCSFMTFPRLQPPGWLQTITVTQKRKTLVCEFLKELTLLKTLLPSSLDEKSGYEFSFLSTIISSLLVYHTSWISTIDNDLKDEIYENHNDQHASSSKPIYSQLSQIFGNTHKVNRTCKVIVIGENNSLINSLLFIISFFMRSCTLIRCENEDDLFNTMNLRNFDNNKRNNKRSKVHAFSSTLNDSDTHSNINDTDIHGDNSLYFLASLNVVDIPRNCFSISNPSSNPYKTQGRSLFGAFCKTYASDFALMGLYSRSISLGNDLEQRISRDLYSQCKFWPLSNNNHSCSLNNTMTPPPLPAGKFVLDSSSCIVVNTDVRSCEVFTYQPFYKDAPLYSKQLKSVTPNFYTRTCPTSMIIEETLHCVSQMWKMDVPPDACMLFLEERLSYFYKQSLLVSCFVKKCNPRNLIFDCSTVARLLQIPSKYDVELLAILQDQFKSSSISSFLNPC